MSILTADQRKTLAVAICVQTTLSMARAQWLVDDAIRILERAEVSTPLTGSDLDAAMRVVEVEEAAMSAGCAAGNIHGVKSEYALSIINAYKAHKERFK